MSEKEQSEMKEPLVVYYGEHGLVHDYNNCKMGHNIFKHCIICIFPYTLCDFGACNNKEDRTLIPGY